MLQNATMIERDIFEWIYRCKKPPTWEDVETFFEHRYGYTTIEYALYGLEELGLVSLKKDYIHVRWDRFLG